MPTETQQRDQAVVSDPSARIMTIPNQLTAIRLVLAVVLFTLLSIDRYFLASFVIFLVAAGTDWLDGYLARKYHLVTQVGRIFDPFADKIIICGTFICLVPYYDRPDLPSSGIAAWMAVVVVGRELLVTAMRSHFEGMNIDFSANTAGKWKMVLQCLAASLSLFYLARPEEVAAWYPQLLTASIWAAVALTIYSGLGYVFVAMKLIRRPS